MRNYITCNKAIEEKNREAFNACRAFVAATARGKRKERILSRQLHNVKTCGILDRLWYYPETGEVEYCCGQDWNYEMGILRDIFD